MMRSIAITLSAPEPIPRRPETTPATYIRPRARFGVRNTIFDRSLARNKDAIQLELFRERVRLLHLLMSRHLCLDDLPGRVKEHETKKDC